MAYELMDTTSANLVGVYPTQDAALADVADVLTDGDTDAVESLALAFVADAGADHGGHLVAAGADLVALAREHTARLARVA